MKTPLIWKKLVIDGRRMITSAEIKEMARQLGKDERGSLDYLQKHGYIYRILRGIFYVKSPEERERGFFHDSIYEMVSKALKMKGVEQWYFGLETALKLNNMTHEYFTVNYVITDSYRTTKVIQILDSKFQFLKWNKKHFKFGIKRRKGLRYSDREKTVLDLAYKKYRLSRDIDLVTFPLIEYIEALEKKKLMSYLGNYSRRFQQIVEVQL